MILTLLTEENMVSKNPKRLHINRGVRNTLNVHDTQYWRTVAVETTETW